MVSPDVMWDVRKPGPTHPVNDEPVSVINDDGGDGDEHFPDAEGFIHIPLPDGTMEIVFRGQDDQPNEGDGPRDSEFDENLAEHIDQLELTRIAEMLLDGISQD
jgi:hypothetical protein